MTGALRAKTIDPRCMSRSDAAAYVGLTPRGFQDWVSCGRLPGPIPGTHRWDRKALDRALDKLSGIRDDSVNVSAYDEWKKSRA